MGRWHGLNVQTCKHFRGQVPRELADELRDADPEPCAICDAMPHRRPATLVLPSVRKVQAPAPSAAAYLPEETGWLTGLLALWRRRRA